MTVIRGGVGTFFTRRRLGGGRERGGSKGEERTRRVCDEPQHGKTEDSRGQ